MKNETTTLNMYKHTAVENCNFARTTIRNFEMEFSSEKSEQENAKEWQILEAFERLTRH